MTTHQELRGEPNEQFVNRMVATAGRFDAVFWELFEAHVAPRLGSRPAIADLGCGPGVLLRDIGSRVPGAQLQGYDITPEMIEHAKTLDYGGSSPTLEVLDLASGPLPMASATLDLAVMTRVLHIIDDPFTLLAEIRRALKADGTFLLFDWVRIPLSSYLDQRAPDGAENLEALRGALRLFPVHAKYTVDDWRWLLGECGFSILAEAASHGYFQTFILGR